jgi:putative Mn2+ efflux pump MntP
VSVIELFVIGIALSADAFAVTISNCMACGPVSRGRLMLMPILFGAFQALMPTLGYFIGGIAAELIETYSSIVIFLILGFIGGNMLREGVLAIRASRAAQDASDEVCVLSENSGLLIKTLVIQAVATAIDAFAVGVGFRAVEVSLPLAVSIIGWTTFALCCVAIVIGKKLGDLLGDWAQVAGGVVLLAIGLKALIGF